MKMAKDDCRIAKPVSISVQALYEKYGEYLTLGSIHRSEDGPNTYFELFNEEGELACMDGEEWTIENDSGPLITFLAEDGEGGAVRFTLTREEFEIATFK